jgi:hypothetical protein
VRRYRRAAGGGIRDVLGAVVAFGYGTVIPSGAVVHRALDRNARPE